jgi:hypothetical protein
MAGLKRPREIDYESSAATAVFLFGEENARRLAEQLGRKGALDYRGILEASTPTTQCNNAIEKFVEGAPCYLCGIPIYAQGKKAEDETYPECEHIMPLVQARWYNLAYYPTRPYDDSIHLEYAWAHRCCNQAKSTQLFVSYPADNGTVTIQDTVISMTLDSIVRRARKAVSQYKQLEEIIAAIGTKTRTKIIIQEKVKPLVDWINKIPHTVPGAAALLQLSGAASLIDPSTRPGRLRELEETLFLTEEELARIQQGKDDREFITQYVEKVIAERVDEEEAAEALVALSAQTLRARRSSVVQFQNKKAELTRVALDKRIRKDLAASSAEAARAAVALVRTKNAPPATASAMKAKLMYDEDNAETEAEGGASKRRSRRRKTRRMRGRRSPLHKNVLHTTLRGRRK